MSTVPQDLHDFRRKLLNGEEVSDDEITQAIERLRARRESTTAGFQGSSQPQRPLNEILGLPTKEDKDK